MARIKAIKIGTNANSYPIKTYKKHEIIKKCAVKVKRINLDKNLHPNRESSNSFGEIPETVLLNKIKKCKVKIVRLNVHKIQINGKTKMNKEKLVNGDADWFETKTKNSFHKNRIKVNNVLKENSIFYDKNNLKNVFKNSKKNNANEENDENQKVPSGLNKRKRNGKIFTEINLTDKVEFVDKIHEDETICKVVQKNPKSYSQNDNIPDKDYIEPVLNDKRKVIDKIVENSKSLYQIDKINFATRKKTKKYNLPESNIEEGTFFRGPQIINNCIESELRLAQNIQRKQTSQKIPTKKNIKSISNKGHDEFNSVVEEKTERKAKTNKTSNQITKKVKNVIKNSKLKSGKITVENNNEIPIEELHGDNGKLIFRKTRMKNLYNTKTVENEENENIFDFQLSKSNSLDTKKNDNDNYIHEMIKLGEVEVVKYKKGTGRLKTHFKRPKVKKQIVKTSKKLDKQNQNIHQEINVDYNVDNNFTPNKTLGRFSNLARSAMKKHAENNLEFDNLNKSNSPIIPRRTQITDNKILLEAAKNFLSKLQNNSNKSAEKSNIINSNDSIPWRAEDENLPSTFNFSRNSLNLPSISSDIPYPASPRKKSIPRNYHSHEFETPSNLNKSNIENIHPHNVNSIRETNPRKALNNRSPLKKINILDVIHLPPLNLANLNKISTPIIKSKKDLKTQSFNISEIVDESLTSSFEENNERSNESIGNYFGFEENFGESDDEKNQIELSTKAILKRKCKSLKRLSVKKLKHSKPTRINAETIKAIYKSPVKFKNIAQIFSSTMLVNKKRTSDEEKEKFFDDHDDGDEILRNLDEDLEISKTKDLHFFDDLTDDSKLTPIRTYTRTNKKRKKMRHEFVTFLESDSEEEPEEKIKKKPVKPAQQLQNRELDKFAEDFNSMCNEVENYELMIE